MPPSVCSSCYLLLSHWADFYKTCTTYIFPCIYGPSICPSGCLFLNYWAEFNQTCYITFPQGKDVLEQHYLSMYLSFCASVICPSCYLLLSHWVELNQTCVQEQHYFLMHLSVCPSICLSRYLLLLLGGIHSNLLHHFPSW